MRHERWTVRGATFALFLVVAACSLRVARGQDKNAELRSLIEQQAKKIAELKLAIDAKLGQQAETATPTDPAKPALNEDSVKKIVAEYLRENPGAGMPPGVQSGYSLGNGFVVRSAPNPEYVKWNDESQIPFELRIRGRLMLAYQNYKTTDRTNHLTNTPSTLNANTTRQPDFSQLEVKRLNVVFQGSAFDPDLHYNFNILGSTRGIPGLQNNRVIETLPPGGTDPNASGISPTGGGFLVDHAVTLFEAWVSYDFHGCASEKGCGPDCPEGTVKYRPTYTIIAGKMKPFFGLDEFLGNANQQFVEFSMADLFFDADDDLRLTAAGVQIKTFEDRFFLQSIVTNGSEGTLQPNAQMDNLPGFITGVWYDLGGSWNPQRQAWDLYGDCISDIDYSVRPVVRIGGAVNLVPMNRRSLYGDAEQSRFYSMPGGPAGTRLINLLNGDAGLPAGAHGVDMFDAYSFNAFAAGKFRGFSLCNEWWFRDLDNFRTTPNGLGNIIYQDTVTGAPANALFTAHSLFDYGTTLQGGYFIIPKRLELAARWSWVRGRSGDINGLGTFHTVTIPGFAAPVHVVNGAFRQFHEADEYTVGINYYFKRQQLKWQTDFGIYNGGNPAAGGTSIAGYIAGLDGYLIRTQFQLMF